ncbi:MAG: hypothetical protein RR744_00165 [Cellulosilyticaceae bacterium]
MIDRIRNAEQLIRGIFDLMTALGLSIITGLFMIWAIKEIWEMIKQ